MFPLQTIIDINRPPFGIDYHSKVFLIGSCFTEHIGNRLERMKFNVVTNPFGVLYNPVSVGNALQLLVSNKKFTEKDIDFYNEKWFSFLHHSRFSSTSKENCLEKMNRAAIQASSFLKSCHVIFITLGTSYVYKYKKTGNIVANCHKIPSKQFDRIFLNPEDTVSAMQNTLKKLLEYNPALQFVFTVSPVRHLKDGAVQNQQSKASLLLSVKKLINDFPGMYYFPSYEIFMDELRDYRYYDKDMLHPSEAGTDYIWEKFKPAFFDEKTIDTMKKIDSIIHSYEHKPFWPETDEYRKFAQNTLIQIESITKELPHLPFEEEIAHFRKFC